MASPTLPGFLATPQQRIQTAKVVAGVLAGAAALACSPFMLLRMGEFHVYFQHQPLRVLAELFGGAGLIGSAVAQTYGAKCPEVITKAIQRYLPAKLLSQLPVLPAPASIALRLAAGALLWYSMKRGTDPRPRAARDMKGKTALVTGGTSGIGYETALAIAGAGAHVILIVRNQLKGEHHAKLIREATGNANVTVLVADQADLKAVADLASAISAAAPGGLDVVVLNAGLAPAMPLVLGPSGYESTFTCMHLSHALLTKMVWKSLNKDARVIVTSSVGHIACGSIDELMGATTDVNDGSVISKSGQKAYARAKFANALFARELGRLADTDARRIRVSAHHPGAVATNIWNGALPDSIVAKIFNGIAAITMRDNYLGAATLIDAAIGLEPLDGQSDAPNGSYYVSSMLVDSGMLFNPLLKSQEATADFWKRTEVLIAPFTPAGASWVH